MTHTAKKLAKEQVMDTIDKLVSLKAQERHYFSRKMEAERDDLPETAEDYEKLRAKNWTKQVNCTRAICSLDHNGGIRGAVIEEYLHQKSKTKDPVIRQQLEQKIQLMTALPGLNEIALEEQAIAQKRSGRV